MLDVVPQREGITGNRDLFVTDEFADSFGDVAHILRDETCLRRFSEFDDNARRFKKLYTAHGVAAVLSALAALEYQVVAISLQALNYSTPIWLDISLLSLGLISALIVFSSFAFGLRAKWLQNVYARESLRMWRHQLVLDGAVVDLIRTDREEHVRRVKRSWAAVAHDISVRDGSLGGFKTSGVPLDLLRDVQPPTDDALLATVLGAQKILRLDYQVKYVDVKDSEDGAVGSPRGLARVAEWLSTTTLAGALVLSAVELVLILLAMPSRVLLVIGALSIGLAVGSAAIRALRDGLTVPQENESYADYGRRILQMKEDFESTADPKERWEILRRVEIAAAEELHRFLTIKSRSRFIL